jgi:hypothetical protein
MLPEDVRLAERALAEGGAYEPVLVYKPGTDVLRPVYSPCAPLKRVQKWLAAQIQSELGATIHEAAHGFVPQRSIVTAARLHAEAARSLLTLDLQDFFSSVGPEDVARLLRGTELVRYLPLLTWEGVLPQGAPTSPILANLAARRLDADLAALGCVYTRYADDLAFSSPEPLPDALHDRASDLVALRGFVVHPYKAHRMDRFPGPHWSKCLHLYGLSIGDGRVWIPGGRRNRLWKRVRRASRSHDPKRRAQARGVLGFVQMVYGELPRNFAKLAPLLKENP